ncbi:MAG: XdhC/CoxI family protein, partial [Pseudomonadota bacterium]
MHHEIYQEIVRLSNEGQEAAVATVIVTSGSTPREEGAKMLVRADGSIMGTIGGGSIEKQVIQEALAVIRSGKPKKLAYRLQAGEKLGMICGGDIEIFVEPILVTPHLYIFGGGHIALPLVKMAHIVGFKITIIDDRPEFANPGRFPEAEQTIISDMTAAFEQLTVDQSSYIVIITYGHKCDEAALAGALKTPARYIGMIGSKEKNRAVFSRLLAKGYPQEDLDRVHAPIGLRIMAQTPEEIAVSILAE